MDSPRPPQRPYQGSGSRPPSRPGGPGGASGGPGGRSFGGRKPFIKRKSCRICADKMEIDYKVPNALRPFASERGKILSRRITGNCAKHQHKLTQAIKRARILAMMPFTSTK